jgi:hypothetical protein
MTLRHAAALALVGWYLMVPPTFDGQVRVNINAPIAKWTYFESYDSAQQCEHERTTLALKLSRTLTQAQGANPRTTKESTATQFLFGKCVATDDPRLKGN